MVCAVMLAAGRGRRLRPYTKKYPKPLAKIAEKPIIEHTITALKDVGIENCVIITGYLGSSIRRYLEDGAKFGLKIRYCYNPQYSLGNAISLKMAEKTLKDEEPFLLLMADHYVDKAIIEKAMENINREPLLCIDRKPCYPPQIKDATRVLVDQEGYIVDIGKKIPAWNAVDTGLFLLDNTIFEIIRLLEKRNSSSLTVTECIKHWSLNINPVWGCEVYNHLWFDIDTQQDVTFVESFLCEALKCQKNGTE